VNQYPYSHLLTPLPAVHLNAYHLHPQPPQDELEAGLDDSELKLLQRAMDFDKFGIGYNTEQATKPATIGIVVSSDPVALLAW
jgi:microsomal epoxide hydrolase